MTKPRRVCVVTGTRAEYGLLYWTIKGLHERAEFDLQLVVTGMHLSPEFGYTMKKIQDDGFPITETVEILLSSDTPVGTSKAIGLGLISFSETLNRLRPDVVLVVGDRFEIFAVASAAMVGGFPVAHCSGGELTEGVIDDAFRHAITKFSHLHFVATDVYRNRVIQLGESPESVFIVGGLGIENIRRLDLQDQSQFEAAIGQPLMERNLLITYHPVTLEPGNSAGGFHELLSVLDGLDDTLLIFTKPNADPGGHLIGKMIDEFVDSRPAAVSFTSMGQREYLSALALVNGIVGNSSSGIIEAPSVHTGTVNVGSRQRGRVMPASVINCVESRESIKSAVDRLFSDDFRAEVAAAVNPYDHGNASVAILDALYTTNLSALGPKRFHDVLWSPD